MRKFKLAKLVRDKIISEIISNGDKPIYRILSNNEFVNELKRKLLEETKEIVKVNNPSDLQNELADLQEIIDSILKSIKLSKAELKRLQISKRNKTGGFSKKYYIEYTEAKDDNVKQLQYFLSQPDRFPEIK